MLRKFLILLNLFLVFGLLSPLKTFAHFPATDNSMNVEFHVEPYHDPIPGQKAYLQFLFDDKEQKFDLNECDCILSISEKNKVLYKKQLIGKKDENTTIWESVTTYVFPKRGIYHLQIIGKSKTLNAFQPFDVSWEFRVDPKGSHGLVEKKPSSSMPMIIFFITGITIFIAVMVWLIKGIVEADNLDNERKIR